MTREAVRDQVADQNSTDKNEISAHAKATLSLPANDDFDRPGYSPTDDAERWITPYGLGEARHRVASTEPGSRIPGRSTPASQSDTFPDSPCCSRVPSSGPYHLVGAEALDAGDAARLIAAERGSVVASPSEVPIWEMRFPSAVVSAYDT
jgi:hypothetical protein